MDERQPDSTHNIPKLLLKAIWEIIATVIPAVLFALFINVHIAEAVVVESGPSMQPNLYRGDRVMMEKISYRLHPPKRGDIVVADRPGDQISLIKRVIALPGETIEIHNGHVSIDGRPLGEPWVVNFGGRDHPPTTVPEGHVFILGDNRQDSYDSRSIGPVSINTIMGCVRFIYWPPERIQLAQ